MPMPLVLPCGSVNLIVFGSGAECQTCHIMRAFFERPVVGDDIITECVSCARRRREAA